MSLSFSSRNDHAEAGCGVVCLPLAIIEAVTQVQFVSVQLCLCTVLSMSTRTDDSEQRVKVPSVSLVEGEKRSVIFRDKLLVKSTTQHLPLINAPYSLVTSH